MLTISKPQPTPSPSHSLSIVKFSCLCIALLPTVYAQETVSREFAELLYEADDGDAVAQFEVGLAYESGTRVSADRDKALQYYLMAAQQGLSLAQNSLGSMYQDAGKYDEAFSWYEKAAMSGDYMAINNLAYLYDEGLGVENNDEKALSLYLRAANLGHPDAMWNIAILYNQGELGEIDEHLTCVWALRTRKYVARSKLLDGESVAIAVEQMKNAMRKDEFLNCEADANNWSPSHGN